MRLYCIPGGGTPAATFYKWTGRLGKDIEINVLEYPGRGMRKQEAKAGSVEDIAADMYRTISSQSEEYFLLSSCTGAQIVCEICRLISRYNAVQPHGIILFSAEAPDSRLYCSRKYISEENFEVVYKNYRSFFERASFADAAETARQRARELIALNKDTKDPVFPKNSKGAVSFEQEMMLDFADKTVAMLNEDWTLAAEYSAKIKADVKLESPLTLIYGTEDDSLNDENIRAWNSFAGNGFELIRTQGGHEIILDDMENCIALVRQIISKHEK